MTQLRNCFVDIECYRNFFYLGLKREFDGKRIGFELSSRNPDGFNREFVRGIFYRYETVGFNSLGYDLPLIWYATQPGITNQQIKEMSDAIILGGVKWWDVQDMLGIRIPREVQHIDLIEPQPNAFASLKILNGRLHGKQLQDLPYEPDTILTHEQMERTARYCLHSDLDATENLWNALKEPIELRRALSREYRRNLLSKSDSQIGEAIVKKRVEEITGVRPERAKGTRGQPFKYPIPDFVRFETPELQEIVERLRETTFIVNAKGKIDLPPWLDGKKVTIDGTTYAMGIGGLHSTESNRAVYSSTTHVLVDADVASQYPSIILMLGLYPKALGPAFLTAYGGIKSDRLEAKKKGKAAKAELKEWTHKLEEAQAARINDTSELDEAIKRVTAELRTWENKDKSGKISLNGVYGKLGSVYSLLYGPHLLISTTLTGQLSLLMLIEMASKRGIKVVSGNTDGVLFFCPREMYAGIEKDRLNPCALEEVTSEWERLTGFALEFGEYSAIYNQSVNSYFAIKPDGGHKRKGPLGNPWNTDPADFSPRVQLMKNPQMTICSDAALMLIKHGTPVEETIRECRDITQFVTVIKAAKGATWRDGYLGKVVRYYWGRDGEPIYEAKANETTGNFKKIPKTDGAIECMRLPDEFPDDIDYPRYVEEAESILRDLGYYGARIEPVKKIRARKDNAQMIFSNWSIAA